MVLFFRTCYITYSSGLQDFGYYLAAAKNLLSGNNPYSSYPPQVYPPASLFLFIPFSLLPYSLATFTWTTISILSLFFGLLIFYRLFKTRSPSKTEFLVLFLISFQTFPVKYGLAQGQINFLVFLGISLFLYFIKNKKDLLTGLVLSILITLKFNPVFFLLYLLLLKQYRAIFYSLIFFFLINLLSNLVFNLPLTQDFFVNIYTMSTQYSTYYYNQSLAAFFGRLFLDQSLARLANTLTSIILWLFVLYRAHKIKISPELLSLIFIQAILITSPISWQHYSFWTFPAFVYLFNQQNKLSTGTKLFSLLPFLLINLNLKNPQVLSNTNPLYSHVLVGNLLLLVLLLIQTKKSKSSGHNVRLEIT